MSGWKSWWSRNPLGATGLIVVAEAGLGLMINLAASLLEVSAGWRPFAVWGAVGALVVLTVLLRRDRARVESTEQWAPVPGGHKPVLLVGAVPPLAEAFQTRALEQHLAPGDPRAVVSPLVLYGMGGVGKTQLAARIARRAQVTRTVELLVWVDASQPGTILAQYQLAARRTGLPIQNMTPQQAAEWFLDRLSHTTAAWLVVLDNVTDPDHLAGWWPPCTTTGHTVITTRRADAVLNTSNRSCVPVGVFTRTEAHQYLDQALASDLALADDVAGVAEDLGRLPLALSHAAAFMRDRNLPCSQYRTRFAEREDLTDVMPEQALPDAYTRTLSTTLSLSIEAADALSPVGLAERLLLLASVLDGTSPRHLYTTQSACAWLADVRRLASSRDAPVAGLREQDAVDALHSLRRLSLIELTEHTVTVHNLVQSITRDRNVSKVPEAAQAAAAALLDIWPDNDATTGAFLRRNTTSLTAHLPNTEPPRPIRHQRAHSTGEIGDLLGTLTEYEALQAEYIRFLELTDRAVAPTYDDRLGSWGGTDDLASTVAESAARLAGRVREQGLDHFGILAARSNLALMRGDASDVVAAVAEYEALLADRARKLGPYHHSTMTARAHLAFARGQVGDAAGAADEFEALLAVRITALGPDHSDTLRARDNLAYWRGETGDVVRAISEHEALLADRERLLGPDHSDTLRTRNNLIHRRGEAGDVVGAIAEYKALLVDLVRVLGPDHPHTLDTRGNLAQWQGTAGDVAGAVAEYEALLADQLRLRSPYHPASLATRSNLAHWRGEAGDGTGAVTGYEKLLADELRVLGPNHPRTMGTRRNLAHWQERTTDP